MQFGGFGKPARSAVAVAVVMIVVTACSEPAGRETGPAAPQESRSGETIVSSSTTSSTLGPATTSSTVSTSSTTTMAGDGGHEGSRSEDAPSNEVETVDLTVSEIENYLASIAALALKAPARFNVTTETVADGAPLPSLDFEGTVADGGRSFTGQTVDEFGYYAGFVVIDDRCWTLEGYQLETGEVVTNTLTRDTESGEWQTSPAAWDATDVDRCERWRIHDDFFLVADPEFLEDALIPAGAESRRIITSERDATVEVLELTMVDPEYDDAVVELRFTATFDRTSSLERVLIEMTTTWYEGESVTVSSYELYDIGDPAITIEPPPEA